MMGLSTVQEWIQGGLIKVTSTCSGCEWRQVSYANGTQANVNAINEHAFQYMRHSCKLNQGEVD